MTIKPAFIITVFLMLVFNYVSNSQLLTGENITKYKSWPRFKMISQVYEINASQPLWIKYANRQKELSEILQTAPLFGLNQNDFQGNFFKELGNGAVLKTTNDSIDADVRLTDAAIHFFTELQSGNQPPAFGYKGLNYSPDFSLLIEELKRSVETGQLKHLMTKIQPQSAEYNAALKKLQWFQQVIAGKNFKEIKIISSKADSSNAPLISRLYQLGFLDSMKTTINKKELLLRIKAAQMEYDLLNDGVLRSTTLEAFNIPLRQRIEELKLLVNTIRWLEDIKQKSSALILNIPAANFVVYEKGKVVMESRVIVGKKSTPTPTLTSTITEVILYPYWTVPDNIAINEMLPLIKKNVGYLNAGNYQVLNRQGKVLNPYSINWHSLSSRYFPYIIRQSTGCDNALGLVKFNFYNPFTVYLHDTPTKILFSSARRFYSHGCMRVEKPEELAHYVLGTNRVAIDTLTAKGCIYKQSPVIVPVQQPLPVIILYSTAWYNSHGDIRFYGDIYNRLNFSINSIANKQ